MKFSAHLSFVNNFGGGRHTSMAEKSFQNRRNDQQGSISFQHVKLLHAHLKFTSEYFSDGSMNRFLNSSLKTNQSDPGKTNFLAEMYF